MEKDIEIINDEKECIKMNTVLHKDSALQRLDNSFLKHIEKEEYKKSDLLAYWVKDFSNYHDNEDSFDSSKLKIFKRGDIIKVNLGFNIGNELGGLHYCVVINKKDNKKSGTLNVIPLSSFKEGKKYNMNTCLDLGDELYTCISNKQRKMIEKTTKEIREILNLDPRLATKSDLEKLKGLAQQLEYLSKVNIEIDKMKHGTIALVHQITTISKQRIYKTDMLKHIKLSNSSLDKIDERIKEMYIK
ncbi:MAG: type II toxin-antitoxin system PemK/MazF family toxin [Clostridia bacterium]|nr:type II toxin-antitoxin system PemK/MazF family toxin [Clostridia bacterium]